MPGLAILAAALLVFLAALAGFWLALFRVLRWGAFALASGRPARLRRQRALWALLGGCAGLACLMAGFLGISALMFYGASQ